MVSRQQDTPRKNGRRDSSVSPRSRACPAVLCEEVNTKNANRRSRLSNVKRAVKFDKRYTVDKRITAGNFSELYYKHGVPRAELAKMLSASESSLCRYIRRHHLRRRVSRYNLSFEGVPELDLAYLAGLFDGEGNITATVGYKGIIRAEVSITNTDSLVLEHRRFFTHYRFRTDMGYLRNTSAHVLYSHNFKDICSLLLAISPYLKLKKTRASLMMKLCASRMRRFRQPYSYHERRWVAQIRELNSKKGKRK